MQAAHIRNVPTSAMMTAPPVPNHVYGAAPTTIVANSAMKHAISPYVMSGAWSDLNATTSALGSAESHAWIHAQSVKLKSS